MCYTDNVIMSAKDVAKYLGVTICTLQHWRTRKVGPKFVAMSANMVRYRLEDVDAWLALSVVDCDSYVKRKVEFKKIRL